MQLKSRKGCSNASQHRVLLPVELSGRTIDEDVNLRSQIPYCPRAEVMIQALAIALGNLTLAGKSM